MKDFLLLWYLILLVIYPLGATNILVDNFSALLYYTSNSNPGDTILIANGTYNTNGIMVEVSVENITIKSQSGIRDSVILNGYGMYDPSYGNGFWVNANNVTISDLTIQNFRNNCIRIYGNIDGLHVTNCIFRDGGEQFIHVSESGDLSPSENGIIENCLFEYTAGIGPRYYIGGVVGHFCKDWIIKNNVFKHIRSPDPGSSFAEHAIHFWVGSENILVEKNLIINCDRGIGFGMGSSANSGGIIRNNMIYHDANYGEVGISLESSPNTQVYNNSVFMEHDYYNAIEYRFSETQNVYIANNLTNKNISSRNDATGTIEYNNTNAIPDWFIEPSAGDLHLSSDTLSQVVDQGISIPGLVEDFDGDIRPQGTLVDIGADEYLLPTLIEYKGKTNPQNFCLKQNYPNPFNPITTIEFTITHPANVTLTLYNLLGQKIMVIFSGRLGKGLHRKILNSGNLPSGAYYYELKANKNRLVKKCIIIK